MAYNRSHARSLCTTDEYTLFVSSLRGEIEKLPRKEVQNRIKRSRTLRDKYRDLHQRQRLDTRARTGSKKGAGLDVSNARTEQKAKLFTEALARYEARLELLKAS